MKDVIARFSTGLEKYGDNLVDMGEAESRCPGLVSPGSGVEIIENHTG